MGIHCRDKEVVLAFGLQKPVGRLIVNGPTTQGAVGYSTDLEPSMTLGCGAMGGNITTDNIGPRHLINVKRVAYPRAAYFDEVDLPFEAKSAAAPVTTPTSEVGQAVRGSDMIERTMMGARVPASRDLYSRKQTEESGRS